MTYRATFPPPLEKKEKADRGKWKPSKKDLVSAITEQPEKVRLTCLNLMGGWSGIASELPVGYKADVVGPDPERDRKWYATITRHATGLKIR